MVSNERPAGLRCDSVADFIVSVDGIVVEDVMNGPVGRNVALRGG